MAQRPIPKNTDTVIVGNGPSALILSFILHGNIPYYNPRNPHPDPILHGKLIDLPSLIDIDVPYLTAHFAASRISYSTQALPIGVLLDTLARPLADTEPGTFPSCIEWRYEPQRHVPHIILGNAAKAGGQWADAPVAENWNIQALSYAEQLSLPGYSFADHQRVLKAVERPEFHRPTRREVADYLAAYPIAVGINNGIWPPSVANHVSRNDHGFFIGSHGIHCKHLILASGVFSHLIPARPLLQPLFRLPDHSDAKEPPLLVVGSGFTAADIIISTLPKRRVIHIYKWSPETRPTPLRACHRQAYPDYASVYRRMKQSAVNTLNNHISVLPMARRKSNPFFDPPQWDGLYEGLPNTYITDISMHGDYATVTLKTSLGHILKREISNLQYVIGRQGSLDYLDEQLMNQVLGSSSSVGQNKTPISTQSLRAKTEDNLEVASDVFAIGSLTGDTLVRFALGGCVFAAREIFNRQLPSSLEYRSSFINHNQQTKKHVHQYSVDDGPDKLGRGMITVDHGDLRHKSWRRSSFRSHCLLGF